MPTIGTEVALAPNPKAIRDIVIDKYIARYLVHEKEINVLRIWHHKEDRS